MLSATLWAQKTTSYQRQLERRRAQLQKEISIANSKLNIEKKKEKNVLSDLKESEEKISLIEKLINYRNRGQTFRRQYLCNPKGNKYFNDRIKCLKKRLRKHHS